jgi:DNA-binding transcriptional LysR family regulator
LGKLIRVLPDYEPESLGIHAVYLSRVHQPRLLRLMLDFLSERYSGAVAPWDQDIGAIKRRKKRA